MVSQRDWATPPAFEPLRYRLADAVDGPHPYTGHQKLGVQFTPDDCSFPLETSTTCITGVGLTKEATGTIPNRGADSFVIFTWLDCTLVGLGQDELRQRTERAHRNNAQTIVEQIFWAGGNDGVSQHLAANAPRTEVVGGSTVNLQTAATQLGPVTGGVDVVEAIGRLEQAMAECYGGTPLIHVQRGAVAHLAANHQVETRGSRMYTMNGSIVVPAPGYPGSGPDGESPPAGITWFYATGAVKMWQSELIWQGRDARDFLNRSVNDTVWIVEQRFTLAWDCCHFAIPVNIGGVVTGTWNSAT